MKVCSTNKKYFAKDDGTPLFLAGSYDMAPVCLGVGLWGPHLDAMKGKANYIRIVSMAQDGNYLFHTYEKVAGSGKTASGNEGKFNLNKLNPKYFAQLDKILAKAKSCGVYVHISLFNEIFIKEKSGCGFKRHYFGNGNHVNTSEIGNVDIDGDDDGTGSNEFYNVAALKGQPVPATQAAVARLQKEYVDRVLSVANPYDNVFFEVGNELLAPDWVAYWVNYISNKTFHPITIPAESFKKVTPKLDGICYHRIKHDFKLDLDILVGLDSDGDADAYDQADPNVQREGAWKTFLSGHSILGNYAETIIRKVTPAGTIYSNDSRLALQFVYFGFLQKFINESGFKMELASQITLAGGTYCLAAMGSQYVAYLGTQKSCSINLTGYPYKFKVRWFNSKNGTFTGATKEAGGGVKTFTAPVGFDVLFLEKK